MPITAIVEFKADLTKVAITDKVFGGYCKDTDGKEVYNRTVKNGAYIEFRAVSDDDEKEGTVEIVGTKANGHGTNRIYSFRHGDKFDFP